MQKLLSVIIPTYNKEQTLDKCLASVLSCTKTALFEVLVVNDGSTDHSVDIIHSYQKRFPEIVRLIDKENGNYGSTINAALPLVKGKYVKILDADDWFDESEFRNFLSQLKDIDSDLVITHFMYNHASGYIKVQTYHEWKYKYIYQFEEIAGNKIILNKLFMHAVTYRTELLIKNGYRQTEGVSYTDNEWIFYPMFYVKTVCFLNCLVYHYSIGIDGQTMAPETFIRNAPKTQSFAKKMINAYAAYLRQGGIEQNRREYLLSRIKWFVFPLYKIYLVLNTDDEFRPELVNDLELAIKKADSKLYKAMAHFSVGHVFHYHYVSYWRYFHIRIPRWLVHRLIQKKVIGFPL